MLRPCHQGRCQIVVDMTVSYVSEDPDICHGQSVCTTMNNLSTTGRSFSMYSLYMIYIPKQKISLYFGISVAELNKYFINIISSLYPNVEMKCLQIHSIILSLAIFLIKGNN